MEEEQRLKEEEEKKNRIERMRSALPTEPAEGTEAIVTIRFQLPSTCKTTKLARRFLKTDNAQVCFARSRASIALTTRTAVV